VANAHPLLLELADDTALSNDDDGVAAYIEKLFP
jgi:hydroxymethylpyrimidine pyrophosphatase-like HAD family hydrolase